MSKRPPESCKAALDGIRLLIGALSQSARSIEQRSGATNAQIVLLRELAQHGTLTINQLAERVLTGQNTVSAIVTRLEERGLVARGRSPRDGRVVTVTVTAAGKQVTRRAPEAPTERLVAALCALRPRELNTVTRGIVALNKAMGLEATAEAVMLFERTRTRPPARRRRQPM